MFPKETVASVGEDLERPRNPLRVGVFVESSVVPAWVNHALAQMEQSGLGHLVLIMKVKAHDPLTTGTKASRTGESFLYQWYRKLDGAKFPCQPDAFRPESLFSSFGTSSVLDVGFVRKDDGWILDEDDRKSILSHDLDVVLNLAVRPIKMGPMSIAKHGIWQYHVGQDFNQSVNHSCFKEVLHEDQSTNVYLSVIGKDGWPSLVLEHCCGFTDKQSFRRNANANAWRSSRMLTSQLKKMSHHHEGRPVGEQSVKLLFPSSRRCPAGFPSNQEMAPFLMRQAWRTLHAKAKGFVIDDQWSLAFKFGKCHVGPTMSLAGFTVIQPPRDRFWADPFVINKGGRFFIFFEELPYLTSKGILSVLEINQHGQVDEAITILEKDYHLSYPFVFEYKGEYYMMPETSGNQTIEVYRAKNFPCEWEPFHVVMEGVKAVDSTLCEVEGTWWLFTNLGVDGAPNEEELYLFHSTTPFGPWMPHPHNPVISDCRKGRQAGKLFWHDGHLYRPSQISTVKRGYGVSINRILQLDKNCYKEEAITQLGPTWFPRMPSIHTFNYDETMTVIDVRVNRWKWSMTTPTCFPMN